MTPDELRAWMGRHGLTHRGAAPLLGVNFRAVQYWLVGRSPVPLFARTIIALREANADMETTAEYLHRSNDDDE